MKFVGVFVTALLCPIQTTTRLFNRLARLDNAARCCLILLAALGWSFAGVLNKSIRHEVYAATSARMTLYWWVLVAYLFYAFRKHHQKESTRLSQSGTAWLVVKRVLFSRDPYHYLCAISGGTNIVVTTWATLHTKGGMSTFLNSGAVIALAIWSHWRDKPLTPKGIAVVCIGVLGIAVLGVSGFIHGESNGMTLGLISLVTFSVFLVASDHRSKEKRGTEMLESWTLGGVLPSIVFLPLLIKAGIPDLADVLKIGLLSTVSGAVADILYTRVVSGANKIPMLPAFIISRVSPVLTPVWIGLGHGERPPWPSILGGGIVMVAVIWQRALQFGEQKMEPG